MITARRQPTPNQPSMAAMDWSRVPRLSAIVPISKAYTLPAPHERRKAQAVYRRPQGESLEPIAVHPPHLADMLRLARRLSVPALPAPVTPTTPPCPDLAAKAAIVATAPSSPPPPNHPYTQQVEDVATLDYVDWGDLSTKQARQVAGNLTALYRNKYDWKTGRIN